MKRASALLFGVFLFALVSPQQAASKNEEPPISVKAEVNRAVLTIGDPVEYTVTVRHTPEVQVLSSIQAPPDNIFKINKIEDLNRREDGFLIEGKKFVLTTFRLGQFVIDPVEIEYRIGGAPAEKLATQKIYLTVKSVAEGEIKTDIRDIKTVLNMARRFGLVLMLVLAAGALAVGVWIYFHRRASQDKTQAVEPGISPEDEALIQLNRLFDSDLLRRGLIKEYYLRLSEILRTYLEKRFDILAVESTTDEITRNLQNTDVSAGLKDKIQKVLQAADLAKFAKWKPTPFESIQLNQKSKEIIEEARPKPEGVPGGV